MSRDGNGVYTLPAGYEATTGETILASQHNGPLTDLETDMNTARPVVAGGTGATTATAARDNLEVDAKTLTKSSTYTAVLGDRSKLIECTAAMTLNLTAAATLTDGWYIVVKANGGAVTVDPDGAEQIDGTTTLSVADGKSCMIFCDGTEFRSAFIGATLANIVEDTTPQLGGALDGQGNDLNNLGVVFMTEQAAAEADVAGKGQLWVETATPNVLKFTDDAGTDFNVATTADLVGQQTIWMPAGAMTPTTTNGGEQATEELATNDVMKSYIAFDDSTQEHACFDIQMPKGWNEGTLVCQFIWYTSATSGDCIWGIQAVAVADDDAQDAAYGTAVEVTDTAKGTANDATITAETSAMTVSGSPGAEELVQFKVYRKAADGSDTMTGDAKLVGVKIHYTTDALTDD